MSLNIKLLHSLPDDVIINHIIPYTYMIKPYKNLYDIRNYYMDYEIVDNHYSFNYNNYILINDLVLFCNNHLNLETEINVNFFNILNRNFMANKKSRDEISLYIIKNFYTEIHQNIDYKIRLLWGLFRPKERIFFRTKFIGDGYMILQ